MNDLDIERLVQGNTAFMCDLYQKLQQAEGNLFFSPYSISVALAMTYAGMRGDSEKQMAQVPVPAQMRWAWQPRGDCPNRRIN